MSAHEAALRALDGIVTRQAMVIAFEQVLLLTGLLFLCVLPLALFPEGEAWDAHEPVHVEMEM